MHIDEWLDSPTFGDKAVDYAKFVLDNMRWPAWKKSAYSPWTRQHMLFCTYEGELYRVTGASRMGDIWLATDLARETGYDKRVDVEQCSSWSAQPSKIQPTGNRSLPHPPT